MSVAAPNAWCQRRRAAHGHVLFSFFAVVLAAGGVTGQASAAPAKAPKQARPRAAAPAPCAQHGAVLARAVALHQSGSIAEAIQAYRRFLELCPSEAAVRSNLGAAYSQSGQYDEAIGEYEQALAADRSNQTIRMNLAIALYKAERLADAVRELALVRQAQPHNSRALMLQADCHLQMGQHKEVIALIGDLAAKNPDDLTLAYLMGTALVRDKQFERGGEYIDRILRRQDSAEAHVLMGEVRQGAKDHIRAVQDFARAAELNPDLPGVHTLHGLALLELDDRAAAEDAFRRALARDPNDFEASRQLGILAKLHGRHEEALGHLQHALRLRPYALDVRYEEATLMITLGRPEDALARLQAIVTDAPDYLGAHVSLATLYYRVGRKEDGDRERAIVERLRAERRQEATPAATPGPGTDPRPSR